MRTAKEYIRLLTEYLPYIQKEYEVTGLCLFGSVARGDNNIGSDIDILVDMPPKILKMSALKDFLEKRLNTSVDLVRRHSHLSSKFIDQVLRDGIIIL